MCAHTFSMLSSDHVLPHSLAYPNLTEIFEYQEFDRPAKGQTNTGRPPNTLPVLIALLGLIGTIVRDMLATEKSTSQIVLSTIGKAVFAFRVFEGFKAVRADLLSYCQALDSTQHLASLDQLATWSPFILEGRTGHRIPSDGMNLCL